MVDDIVQRSPLLQGATVAYLDETPQVAKFFPAYLTGKGIQVGEGIDGRLLS